MLTDKSTLEALLLSKVESSRGPDATGVHGHIGIASGYLITRKQTIYQLRNILKKDFEQLPIIFGVDTGDCNDLEMLMNSNGMVSSNPSPNAWCYVQAKSEGIPSVIGVGGFFKNGSVETKNMRLELNLKNDRSCSITLEVGKINLLDKNGEAIEIWEGQEVTIDGGMRQLYLGKQRTAESTVVSVYRRLTDIMVHAADQYGYLKAWKKFRQTDLYKRQRASLVKDIVSDEFAKVNASVQLALEDSDLKIMATAHTTAGIIQARLQFSDISVDSGGDIVIANRSDDTGVGLLRSERYVRTAKELDALRAALIGGKILQNESYREALSNVYYMNYYTLKDLFSANSGCDTVLRTLCMPLNKLFPDELDVEQLSFAYSMDLDSARKRIVNEFQELETFHGCRGARLHSINEELTKQEIRAMLCAASSVISAGGEVKLTILVSMVTFVKELQLYIDYFDAVYESLLGKEMPLPEVNLATMVETTSIYHELTDTTSLKGKHIQFKGLLFGGNDFTAATLNLNRHDATISIIPQYIDHDILSANPFDTLHPTVARLIVEGLRKLSRKTDISDWRVGFGGEQAANGETVAWLAANAASVGLKYVSTSPDMMIRSLLASAFSSREHQCLVEAI